MPSPSGFQATDELRRTSLTSDRGTPLSDEDNMNMYGNGSFEANFVDSWLGPNNKPLLLPVTSLQEVNNLFEPTRLPYDAGDFANIQRPRNSSLQSQSQQQQQQQQQQSTNIQNNYTDSYSAQRNASYDSSSDEGLGALFPGRSGERLFLPDELGYAPLSLASHALLMDLKDDFPISGFSAELESTHLYGISYLNAHKSIEAYDSEVNCLYPIFAVGELEKKFDDIYKYYATHRTFLEERENDWLNIKIIIAIGTTMTGVDQSAGKKLYEDVLSKVERQLISGKGTIEAVVHLLLIHQFQFHSDMGTLAYRTVGFASIQALELGLYRSKDLERMVPDAERREHSRLIFWCLYVMDRRLSIYTKRPFILHDEDIDQKMPQSFGSVNLDSGASEDDLFRAMHLNYMIHYSKLSGKVLEAIQKQTDDPSLATEMLGVKSSDAHAKRDNVQYLIYLMERWKSSLPPELSLKELPSQPSPHGSRKLKWIIYLKSNLILLNIYQSCNDDLYVVPAITTACECIRELGRLYFNTDFYNSCEIQYNHFLVAALEVLYSSLRRQPQLLEKCMPEIKLALKIISLIMKRSKNDRRQGSIWQLVVSFAFKFGLSSPFGAKLLETKAYTS
ncbi:hypothetical protein AWJ20_2774 [Sugiyamaella lignohabitans]|uniref:Xylanolytic transcriptional activator regulatory domain-containing protein n=1 Tax=Sugiyamaella lignohabitans TaxID=796027 RepID=A0A167FDA7_9ASCO|nr:uncharacterized protein AWJ20_2774 [Sugiyamaella lignohabitans]ANB15152.1 hypothetical protein AWJ20_2774 [Sugiyamaella lignohabitans]